MGRGSGPGRVRVCGKPLWPAKEVEDPGLEDLGVSI